MCAKYTLKMYPYHFNFLYRMSFADFPFDITFRDICQQNLLGNHRNYPIDNRISGFRLQLMPNMSEKTSLQRTMKKLPGSVHYFLSIGLVYGLARIFGHKNYDDKLKKTITYKSSSL